MDVIDIDHPNLTVPDYGGDDKSLPPRRGKVRACPELAEGMGVLVNTS
jgi:hypothetical protein